MARALNGASRSWGVRAAAALLAAGIAGAAAPAGAGDASHILQLQSGAAQLQLQVNIDLAIEKPAVSAVPYLGTVPLKVQVTAGPQPMRVLFAFEQLQAAGWKALGTLETGWDLVPALVPGSFLQATGRYRVRAAPGSPPPSGGGQGGRVITPAQFDWSDWREFSFKAGNTVPSGLTVTPGLKQSGKALQQQ